MGLPMKIASGLAACAIALSSVTAFADGTPRGSVKDSAPAIRSTWSGFYAGGAVGQRWSNVDWTHNENAGTDERFSVNPNGFIGGGHVGIQQQTGVLVYGIEASILSGRVDATQRSGPGALVPDLPRDRTAELGDVWSLVGRLGYANNAWLFYAKAGVASGDVKFTHTSVATGQELASQGRRAAGYTVGGGVEYKFHQNWSIGVDYSFTDLDVRNRWDLADTNCNGLGMCADTASNVSMSVLTGRLNFHF